MCPTTQTCPKNFYAIQPIKKCCKRECTSTYIRKEKIQANSIILMADSRKSISFSSSPQSNSILNSRENSNKNHKVQNPLSALGSQSNTEILKLKKRKRKKEINNIELQQSHNIDEKRRSLQAKRELRTCSLQKCE